MIIGTFECIGTIAGGRVSNRHWTVWSVATHMIFFLFHELQNVIVEVTKQQRAHIFMVRFTITENDSSLTCLDKKKRKENVQNKYTVSFIQKWIPINLPCAVL